jgi:hypothetical protein
LKEKSSLYLENLDEGFPGKGNEIKKNKDLVKNDYLNMQRGYYFNASKDILEEMKNIEKNLFKEKGMAEDKLASKKQRGYSFKGWDWEELSTALGLEQPAITYDKDPFSELRAQRIKEYIYALKEEAQKAAIALMRKFLQKLIAGAEKNNMELELLPLWKDLVKIEEDSSFCYVFLALLETLWT